VDQDQSDNLVTAYRVINGRMAQTTPDTAHRGRKLTNGSDEGLVANFIDPALGCTPPTAPDLTNGGAPTPSLALNELFAAARQGGPAALVPTSDPMAQVDGATSTRKTDLYRAGVNMPALPEGQTPRQYCTALLRMAPQRLAADAVALAAAPAPDAASPDLLTFLRDRLETTLGNLGCAPLDTPAPVSTAAGAASAADPSAADAPTAAGAAVAGAAAAPTPAPTTAAPTRSGRNTRSTPSSSVPARQTPVTEAPADTAPSTATSSAASSPAPAGSAGAPAAGSASSGGASG
jgi:hypothetical protein